MTTVKLYKIAFLLFTSSVLSGTALAQQALIWVVSDMYKIFPDTGGIVEFGGAKNEQLKQQNYVWNSDKKLITLMGAKNEVLAFQIIIEKKESDLKNLEITISDLKGPEIIDAARQVRLFFVGYVAREGRYYPDVMVPISIKAVYPFSVPNSIDGLFTVPNQILQAIWVDIEIPGNAKPGLYKGSVFVHTNGIILGDMDLSLQVWDFEIPVKRGFIIDINSYSSPIRTYPGLDAYVLKSLSKRALACEKRYYVAAHEHRACLNILPYHSQRGTLRYGPQISETGKNASVIDWRWFDERFGHYLDGTAYEDGEPNEVFYLPYNPRWPIMAKSPPERYNPKQSLEFEETWKTIGKEYIKHFNERGWTKTEFQIYLNQKPQANNQSFIAWKLDEPTDYPDYQALRYFCDLAHDAFKNPGNCTFKYRMDIGHYWCRHPGVRCYKAKQYDAKADAILAPIDVWYIGWSHAWGAKDKAFELKAKGKEIFIYGGIGDIRSSSTNERGKFYAFYHGGWQGFCAWNQGNIAPTNTKENGRNHIWYNGMAFNYDGPLVSMRLKQWRRGQQDYEYMKLAEKSSGSKDTVQKFAEELIEYKTDPKSKYIFIKFPHPNNNPADYFVARLELASLILNKDVTMGLKRKGSISGLRF